jgi:hypothetical protein
MSARAHAGPGRLALFVMAVWGAGCGRTFGCWPGETVYETLDAKVDVEHVRRVQWSCVGKGGCGPSVSFFLRLRTSPPLEVAVPCSKIELAEDEAGTLVAYRCDETKHVDARWTLLRLEGSEPPLFECGALGEGEKPDFAKVEPLSRSWGRVLGCEEAYAGDGGEVRARLAKRTLAREGAEATRRAYLSVLDEGRYHGDDPWLTSLGALGPDERERLRDELCAKPPKLGPARHTGLARATRLCALDRPEQSAFVLDALAQALVEDALPPQGRAPASDQALFALAAASLTVAPAQAGEAGCAALGKLRAKDRADGSVTLQADVAALLVARAKARCPELAAWAPSLCDFELDCGREGEGQAARAAAHLCTRDELERELGGWGKRTAEAGVYPELFEPPRVRPRLAAVYAQGELPAELVTRNARRRYASQGVGRECSATPHGEPCDCPEAELCLAPASVTEGTFGTCTVRFDDAAKKVTASRGCQPAGAPCALAGTQGACCSFCEGAPGADGVTRPRCK